MENQETPNSAASSKNPKNFISKIGKLRKIKIILLVLIAILTVKGLGYLISDGPLFNIYYSFSCKVIHGGRWIKGGIPLGSFCNEPTLDGGKSCTDGSQCSSNTCVPMNEDKDLPSREPSVGECSRWKADSLMCEGDFIENGKIQRHKVRCLPVAFVT